MIREALLFCTIAAADVGTSKLIIDRGGYELNPLLRGSLKSQIILNAAECLAEGFLVSKVKKGQKRKALIIGGLIASSLVIFNLTQLNRGEDKWNPPYPTASTFQTSERYLRPSSSASFALSVSW